MCAEREAALAAASAFSFPWMPTWLGTQRSLMSSLSAWILVRSRVYWDRVEQSLVAFSSINTRFYTICSPAWAAAGPARAATGPTWAAAAGPVWAAAGEPLNFHDNSDGDTTVLPQQSVAEAVRCDIIGRPALLQRGARGQPPNDVTQQSAQNVNKSPGVATFYIRPWPRPEMRWIRRQTELSGVKRLIVDM